MDKHGQALPGPLVLQVPGQEKVETARQGREGKRPRSTGRPDSIAVSVEKKALIYWGGSEERKGWGGAEAGQ